jgi:hypothetical protein
MIASGRETIAFQLEMIASVLKTIASGREMIAFSIEMIASE